MYSDISRKKSSITLIQDNFKYSNDDNTLYYYYKLNQDIENE